MIAERHSDHRHTAGGTPRSDLPGTRRLTLLLAYAGASLPLMLLFAAGGIPVGELLTGELIAQELVRSAVGAIGLITAVPITTAALITARRRTADDSIPPTAGPRPSARPAGDPWAAFVERHAEWRDGA